MVAESVLIAIIAGSVIFAGYACKLFFQSKCSDFAFGPLKFHRNVEIEEKTTSDMNITGWRL